MLLKADVMQSDLRIPDGWFYVRLDGWNFRSLRDRLGLQKRFDQFLAECLVETAKRFFKSFNPCLAFLFSDEINLLFYGVAPFGGRLDKINSVFAGMASSNLYKHLSSRYRDIPEVSFDCRVIPSQRSGAIDYLLSRQMESYRNCYNAYGQYCLIVKADFKPKRVSEELRGMKVKDLKKLIQHCGVVLSHIPKWRERGILVYWEYFTKRGFDPVINRDVLAERRRIRVEWSPPNFRAMSGKKLLAELIGKER